MSGRSHFLDEEQALVSYFSQMLSEPDDEAQEEAGAPAKAQAVPAKGEQPKAPEAPATAAPVEDALQPQMQLAPEPAPEHEDRPLEERSQPSLESLLEKVGDATEIKAAVETATETATETAAETAAQTATQTAAETATENATETATETAAGAATQTAAETATQLAAETAVETKTQTAVQEQAQTATAVKSTAEEAADLAMIQAAQAEELAQAQAVATETAQAAETAQATETAQAEQSAAEAAADQAMVAASEENETPPDPLAWKNIDLPDEFQALFFLVKGVRFAVPLVELGGIFETPKLTSLFGKPVWYKGMADIRGRKMNVVDTLRWVKPDVTFESDYAYLIMLGKSLWSIGCDTLEGNRVIRRDSVNWRTQAGSRPWLAGIVKKEMCALIHVKAMITMFERGMGMMPGQGAIGAKPPKAD